MDSRGAVHDIPPPGSRPLDIEHSSPRPVKPQEAAGRWDEFLGEGTHSNIHPRTGQPDPNRIVSADGQRSIRCGDHEMNSKPSRHHYHEETWTVSKEHDYAVVENEKISVPLK